MVDVSPTGDAVPFSLFSLNISPMASSILGVLGLVIGVNLARIVFRSRFLRRIPEAGLVIIFGMLLGGLVFAANAQQAAVLNISAPIFFVSDPSLCLFLHIVLNP